MEVEGHGGTAISIATVGAAGGIPESQFTLPEIAAHGEERAILRNKSVRRSRNHPFSGEAS